MARISSDPERMMNMNQKYEEEFSLMLKKERTIGKTYLIRREKCEGDEECERDEDNNSNRKLKYERIKTFWSSFDTQNNDRTNRNEIKNITTPVHSKSQTEEITDNKNSVAVDRSCKDQVYEGDCDRKTNKAKADQQNADKHSDVNEKDARTVMISQSQKQDVSKGAFLFYIVHFTQKDIIYRNSMFRRNSSTTNSKATRNFQPIQWK